MQRHDACGGSAFLVNSTPVWDWYKCRRCGEKFRISVAERARLTVKEASVAQPTATRRGAADGAGAAARDCAKVRFFPARRSLSEVYADLANLIPGYKPRQAQLDLAHRVIHAVRHNTVLFAEVATRAGRSLGYLLPLIEAARLGLLGGPIIIATRTAALRRQLIGHDLPLVARLFREQYGYAVPPVVLATGQSATKVSEPTAIIITSHNRLQQQRERRDAGRPGLWADGGVAVIDEAAALAETSPSLPSALTGPAIIITGTNATARGRAALRDGIAGAPTAPADEPPIPPRVVPRTPTSHAAPGFHYAPPIDRVSAGTGRM